jgi:hypothetical protein
LSIVEWEAGHARCRRSARRNDRGVRGPKTIPQYRELKAGMSSTSSRPSSGGATGCSGAIGAYLPPFLWFCGAVPAAERNAGYG